MVACGPAYDDEPLGDAGEVEVEEADDPSGELGDGDGTDATSGESTDDAAKMVLIHPGKTQHAELVDTLPVAKSATQAARRVVMRLGPDEIPDLAASDTLLTMAEVQVTTRCDIGQVAPGCDYNPMIRAQLILTGAMNDDEADGAGSEALSEAQTLSCTKAEHHCKLAFTAGATRTELDDLPCVADSSCFINLVMWAWHPDARDGGEDKVLVGENEGNYLANGEVGGDKGRLMVVRERGIAAADRDTRQTSGGGSITMPLDASPTLIYSHPLKAGGAGLARDEQYRLEAKIVTDVDGRARFSTVMFLTKDPKDTSGGGLAKTFPTSIGEHNGINCTPGTSPCTTRRVGVFRVTDDIPGPVYANVIAKSEVPGGGNATVTVKRNDGYIESVRYSAAHKQ